MLREPDLMDSAVAAFQSAACGEEILVSVIKGLNYVIQIADCDETLVACGADANKLLDAIVAARPVLFDLIGDTVDDCHVLGGMAGAVGLTSLFGKTKAEINAAVTEPQLHDYFDHTMLLLAELQIIRCLHSIGERGNLLRDTISDCRIVSTSKH